MSLARYYRRATGSRDWLCYSPEGDRGTDNMGRPRTCFSATVSLFDTDRQADRDSTALLPMQ